MGPGPQWGLVRALGGLTATISRIPNRGTLAADLRFQVTFALVEQQDESGRTLSFRIGRTFPKALARLVGAALLCNANAGNAEEPLKLPDSQLEPIKWTDLAGWRSDDHLAAFAAYQTSCQALRKSQLTEKRGPVYRALWNLCRTTAALRPARDSNTARAFFEENFQPVRIARLGESAGLLTGYFEPVVQGSRFPSPEFHVPVYRRPPDLVAAGRKPGSAAFPNKGVRIGRLDEKNQLVPYHDRAAIEAGALDGQKLEICWLKDPFDLLTIQIEGSGRVILEDGTPLRINFDSHNGYPFTSLGHALVERHLIPRGEISIQHIRDWMAANPEEAAKVRATNRSYVFFRITGLSNEGEPVGAQGVPLTPGRSIATDRLHEYGTPFFIEANLPIESEKSASPFRRLMIAQDTGSAIVGPARADLYWGAGVDAGRVAGRIRHLARFVMLLPRELDMVAAGRQMPLPVPKPRIPEAQARKDSTTIKAASSTMAGNPRTAATVGRQISEVPPPSRSASRNNSASATRISTVGYSASHPEREAGKDKATVKAGSSTATGNPRTGAHARPQVSELSSRSRVSRSYSVTASGVSRYAPKTIRESSTTVGFATARDREAVRR
jgi:membrane-bound lytic murein transglycosylase A